MSPRLNSVAVPNSRPYFSWDDRYCASLVGLGLDTLDVAATSIGGQSLVLTVLVSESRFGMMYRMDECPVRIGLRIEDEFRLDAGAIIGGARLLGDRNPCTTIRTRRLARTSGR